MSDLDECEIAAWVRRTCEAQGVPVQIKDRRVVTRVVALLSEGVGDPPGKRSADGAPTPAVRKSREAS